MLEENALVFDDTTMNIKEMDKSEYKFVCPECGREIWFRGNSIDYYILTDLRNPNHEAFVCNTCNSYYDLMKGIDVEGKNGKARVFSDGTFLYTKGEDNVIRRLC